MFSFHTTTHASFFPCGEDQTAAWSEVAGHNPQAALSFNGGAPDPLTSQDLDQIFAPVLDDFARTGFGLSDLEAASAGASNPGYSYTPNVQGQYDHTHMNTNFHAAWLAPTPPLTDSDTIPSPASDAPWDENLLPPTPSAPEPHDDFYAYTFAAAAPPPRSHAEMAWHFEPGQSALLRSPFVDGNGGMMGPYSDFPNTVGAAPGPCAIPLCVANTGASQVIMPGTYIPELPRTILRKRPRSAEETNDDFTQAGHDRNRRSSPRRVKRRTGVNGVLEAAGFTSRARQNPATETPVELNGKSEAAGRGAGMLAAPIEHEVYHRFLPGPSVQEALMGTTVQGQLPWIEGSEECVNLTFTGNAVEQPDVVNTTTDGEGESAEEDGFRIPTGLTERQQRLLVATPEERERGVVRVLKCIVCPKSGFSRWESFTRHCDRTEGHPEDLFFCRFCGDFFSRPEARDRHEQSPPEECLKVSPAKAEEKRTVTLHVHEGFKEEINTYLRFGGKMGELFSQRIKKLYPDSSKRGSRQQSRLKA